MQIDTTLLANDPQIIDGLLNGSLTRHGSVIRDIGGRIVRHLIEAPGMSEVAMKSPMLNPLAGVGGIADAFVNSVGHTVTHNKLNGMQQTLSGIQQTLSGTQQTLSSVLQVSQVAAAASVLNLGVSVAGFAYMGYKLNQLQKSMSTMQQRMEAGFDRVSATLEDFGNQLNYVSLLAEANAREQQRISASLAELHRAVLVSQLSELQSWLEQLSRFPDDSPKDAIRSASKVRLTLSDQSLRVSPEFDPRVMLIADISIRGWMVATATEANLLMRIGQHRDAIDLIENEHPRFAVLSEHWAKALLSDKERPMLETAYRFDAPRFREYILSERVERIAQIHNADRTLSPERRLRAKKEAALEFEMSYNDQLDAGWTHRQLAVAEYLDGLSEMSSRIETLGAFAHECEARKIQSSRDILPGPDDTPGLYLLPAADGSDNS